MNTGEQEPGRHGKLEKPSAGRFGRQELAVLGTTCSEVERLCAGLTQRFEPYSVALVDASHAEEREAIPGIRIVVHDGHTEVRIPDAHGEPPFYTILSSAALIVVNGNHLTATRQLIVPSEGKEDSLRKRAAQLTSPLAIWLTPSFQEVPEWLFGIPGLDALPVIREADPACWEQLAALACPPPPIRVLVLTGGKSKRMGSDKSLMNYHGMPQYQWMAQTAAFLGLPVAVSCRQEQSRLFREAGFDAIEDRVTGIGPLGGITSAFMHDPDSAWLVVACDMPGWTADAYQQLAEERNPRSIATCFALSESRPEPLAAIWEPASYPLILSGLSAGIDCPRSILRRSRPHLVVPRHPTWTDNVNTPEEAGKYR